MWLYHRECSPHAGNPRIVLQHEAFASASPYTNLSNSGQVIGVCSPDFPGAGSGSLASYLPPCWVGS